MRSGATLRISRQKAGIIAPIRFSTVYLMGASHSNPVASLNSSMSASIAADR